MFSNECQENHNKNIIDKVFFPNEFHWGIWSVSNAENLLKVEICPTFSNGTHTEKC